MLPGIGGVEYLVIAALIIIFVGPKDLPLVLRTLGRWWGKVRNFSRDFRTSINTIASDTGIDDIKKSVEQNPKSFTDEMRDSINESIVEQTKNEVQKKKEEDK